MDVFQFIGEVGAPIAGALAAGYFVFLTIGFILDGVTSSVTTLKNIIGAVGLGLHDVEQVHFVHSLHDGRALVLGRCFRI